MTPSIAIIGCGAIGTKRKASLGDARLVACVDTDLARAMTLAGNSGAAVGRSIAEIHPQVPIDIAFVSTTNNALTASTIGALARGCHVLVEKPVARSSAELETIDAAAQRAGKLVRVGFNLRYHPALRKARALVDDGAVGSLMFVRGRYGHGGRVGYHREWRANPELSGGGELIDQGVHLIDLSRWFLGEDFVDIQGFASTFYWEMPVDDNAFLTLRTATGKTAFLHASCSEWKNLFSLEIYGRHGKIHVEGLGGSYGTERVTWYRMKPEMGPPDTQAWEYPGRDTSWDLELSAFLADIAAGRQPDPGLNDAAKALAVVEHVYRSTPSAQPAQ